MARQENFEGMDAMYELAMKAFDELESDDNSVQGKKGKKLALKFERAAMYQLGALQIMQNAKYRSSWFGSKGAYTQGII